ncbi:hypothetical protein [uncultured Nostoc sp.]
MGVGRWALGVGRWSLVIGHWSLGVGCWGRGDAKGKLRSTPLVARLNIED